MRGWSPSRDPLPGADAGAFLLDNFFGRFSNPFYRLRSLDELHDYTIDRITDAPFSLRELAALRSGDDAPDDAQRRLGRFLAASFGDEYEDLLRTALGEIPHPADGATMVRDVCWLHDRNPFRPLLAPAIERELIGEAVARCGLALSRAAIDAAVRPSALEPLPVLRSGAAHERRFRQRVADLRRLRAARMLARPSPNPSLVIIGAGPAGLIRAIAAALRGLSPTLVEIRSERAPRRLQIAVIRSRAVIRLLDELGVMDFLFKEGRVFPLGRLRLEVSLADLEVALTTILRLVMADDPHRVVRYDTSIERIEPTGDRASVLLRGRDSEGSSALSPDLIVIADGRHSPTARSLGVARCERFCTHAGIIAILRAEGPDLGTLRRVTGELRSKLGYLVWRHLLGRGMKLTAGTILQVPGHHYLGLNLAPSEEARLWEAMRRARASRSGGTEGRELRAMLRSWARYGFEAIRTEPVGSAPHTGGRKIGWLPLDPSLTWPIEVVTDRAASFGGTIGRTFVVLEGDAKFTIHPGSAYGCTKAFLAARLFDLLLPRLLPGRGGETNDLAQRALLLNSALTAREGARISRLFPISTGRGAPDPQ